MGCSPQVTHEVVDFSEAYGARSFLERIGVLTADRNPGPRMSPADLLVRSMPLAAPALPTQLLGHTLGDPSPDRGPTVDWPFPEPAA